LRNHKAGAQVDHKNQMMRIDRELVEKALSTAPWSFTVTPRNPAKRVIMGGQPHQFRTCRRPAQRVRQQTRTAQ
jgi:trimethylamine--corrinoid protein Co-methyltransferase